MHSPISAEKFDPFPLGQNARLESITVYPIKSLDGVFVGASRIAQPGGLEFDRRWMLVDDEGNKINGKREPLVHTLRAKYDLAAGAVQLADQTTGDIASFDLTTQKAQLEEWLSRYFGKRVHVSENLLGGFPDDTKRPGPTLISEETLRTVSSWFHDIDRAETLRRFRPNLVVSGVPAFWEDSLYYANEAEGGIRLRIGSDVVLEGLNPCYRCIVPTRQALTGETYPEFMAQFIEKRIAALPDWVASERFEKPYRLALNTRLIGNTPATLRAGDLITRA